MSVSTVQILNGRCSIPIEETGIASSIEQNALISIFIKWETNNSGHMAPYPFSVSLFSFTISNHDQIVVSYILHLI